jgi:NAD-dependent deacetylase
MERIVVLTGAGMSAESGLSTFRGAGGLWEGYPVQQVATPEAWDNDYKLVLKFYNWRRQQAREAQPNLAHKALVRLEERYAVTIITQNVDDLHERAGSTHVLHLHGELMKARSSVDPSHVVDLDGQNIHPGDQCPQGGQLRPHIVWFGEDVPNIIPAMELAAQADILLVIGTSMQVYPAASLVPAATSARIVYAINPDMPDALMADNFVRMEKTACDAVPGLVETLLMGDEGR